MKNYFREWYDESEKGNASGVEIFLFYVNLIILICFLIAVLTDTFCTKYLVLFIPTLIWIFLRSSRKDMAATAHWVAGFLGALGGAASVLLLKIFLK
jgi:hypothetical protein